MRSLGPALLLLAGVAGPLAAQVPIPPTPPGMLADSARPDSVVRPVSPMGAFWRSLLVPGWGQAKLDRKLAAALFIGWEGVTLGMAIKTDRAVGELEESGSGLLESKRQEREDWLVLLAFNHLLSALEAYVSAHLWDFPGDLHLQRGTEGVQAGLRLPLPGLR